MRLPEYQIVVERRETRPGEALGKVVYRRGKFLLGEEKERILKVSGEEYSLLRMKIDEIRDPYFVLDSSDQFLKVILEEERPRLPFKKPAINLTMIRRLTPSLSVVTSLLVRSDGKAGIISLLTVQALPRLVPPFRDLEEASEKQIRAFQLILDAVSTSPTEDNPA